MTTGGDAIDRETAEAWAAYPRTVLEFHTEPPLRVDLRTDPGDAARRAISAIGWPEMAVVTAANPCGETRPAAENARRLESLERRLRRDGTPFLRVDGHAPGGSHCEPCVAVAMPKDRAVELARELEQLAIFHWDGTSFWLVGATGPYAGVEHRLPLPTARE
jgi:hypothetical protein